MVASPMGTLNRLAAVVVESGGGARLWPWSAGAGLHGHGPSPSWPVLVPCHAPEGHNHRYGPQRLTEAGAAWAFVTPPTACATQG